MALLFLGTALSSFACSSSSSGAADAAAPIDSSACPTDRACPSSCCDVGAICVDDGTGNKLCAVACTTSSACPSGNSCCAVLPDGQSACMPAGQTIGQQCLCTMSTECTSGCCGPTTDVNGNPVEPYICKANDGTGYGCCNGGVKCSGGYCCVYLTGNGSQVCEEPCQNSSNCGAGTCLPLQGTCQGAQNACSPK